MQGFYNPSKRISPLLLIYTLLVLFILIPVLSFIHSFILFYSPYIWINLITTFIYVTAIFYIGTYLLIKKAKVRNYLIAFILALLTILFTFIFTVLFYYLLHENTYTITFILTTLKPSNFYNTIKTIIIEGYPVIIKKEVLFIIHGIWMFIVLIFEILISLFFLVVSYIVQASRPFDEVNKKWAKTVKIKFPFIDNPIEFIESLRYDDYRTLIDFEELQDINNNYSIFEIFNMIDYYYITIENVININYKEEKIKEKELCRYLKISKIAGDLLLLKSKQDKNIKIIDEKTYKHEKLSVIYKFVVTSLFGIIMFIAFITNQLDIKYLKNPNVIVVIIVFSVYFITNMIINYLKKDIIILNNNEIVSSNIEQTKKDDLRLYNKIYFTIMSLISISVWIFIIILFWR